MIFRLFASLLLLIAPASLSACTEESADAQDAQATVEVATELPTITVHKTPTCGCCNAWIDHLRTNGFHVEAVDVQDTRPMASRLGVPDNMRSCHTGEVAGYAIEGHIPADDIKRLLNERPDIVGLTVPGMPLGSPGMEAGGRTQPYSVFAIERDGSTSVFAQH